MRLVESEHLSQEVIMAEDKLTFRRYEDGDHVTTQWNKDVVQNGLSEVCPAYIHRTSMPSKLSVRSRHPWLVNRLFRGIDKPTGDTTWQEYAFRRMTMSNPVSIGDGARVPCAM